MNLSTLPLIEQITTYSWYFLKRFFGHTYPKLPDKKDDGFEDQFREYVFRELKPITVSDTHDLGFGSSLNSLSGLSHEIDLVAKWDELIVVYELKNCFIDKNMVINFQQKCLDYFLENEKLLASNCLERIFLTTSTVNDNRIRNFCAIWGIRLIDASQVPIGQCKLWLESINPAMLHSHDQEEYDYILSLMHDIEDSVHTDMNHIFRRVSEFVFEMSPSISYSIEELVHKQAEVIEKTRNLKIKMKNHQKVG